MAYPAETHGGVVTSWIPLTTLFTPSPACSSYFRLESPSLVAFDPGYGFQIDSAVNCQPSAVTTWWEQGLFGVGGSGHTAISILPMTCPHGWSTAATSLSESVSTLAMCCPSAYSLANNDPGSVDGNCQSTITEGQIITYASTANYDTNNWQTTTTTIQYSSYVGAIAIVGWNVPQMMPTSTSIATPASAPTSTSTPVMPLVPAGRTSSASDTATGSSFPSTSSGSLPIETKVGISLGSTLGLIGIASLIMALWVILRRRALTLDSGSGVVSSTNQGDTRSVGVRQFQSQPGRDTYQVVPNEGLYEMSSEQRIGELDAVRPPAELDSNLNL